MTKRVVFFQKEDVLSINILKSMGEDLSKKKIQETFAYLEALVDLGVIMDLHFDRINNKDVVNFLAWGDQELISILKGAKIEGSYDAYKAVVLDEARLNSIIKIFGSRYGLQYRIYEYLGNTSPKKAEAMFYEISERRNEKILGHN